MSSGSGKVAILGVDSLPPKLIQAKPDYFPFLSSLQVENSLCPIRSCDPPITIPAWSVITTGRDPGELGTYGFRNRATRGYMEYELSSSRRVKYPRLWDLVTEGQQAFVMGIPQTYPPTPMNGILVSGILTPGLDEHWIEPPSEGQEFLNLAGGDYLFDVNGYRTESRGPLMEELTRMLDQKERIIPSYLRSNFQFFMSVVIGSDRINHAFWKYVFKDHPRHEQCEQYSDFFRDYYYRLDALLKYWYEMGKELGYEVIILSDHGAKSLKGVFCLNEFLIQQGYLVLKREVESGGVLEVADVDWTRTSLWADGGYCGRIYVNKKGREPRGIVSSPSEIYSRLCTDLKDLEKQSGVSMDLHLTSNLYARCAGVPPDFILYAGELDFRCAGRIHKNTLFLEDNDTGPDGVNHDFYGLIAGDVGEKPPAKIQDVFAMVSRMLRGQE